MDTETLQFYANNTASLVEQYNTVTDGISKYFTTAFDLGSKILDIGCGSGRDLRILHEMNYHADGIDACEEFVQYINQHQTGYGCTVTKDTLPELTTVVDNKYAGILCSATLMHLPEEQLFDACFAIRRVLQHNGRLLLSIPLPDPTIDEVTKRDSVGRFFNGVTPEELQLLFERIGFKLLNRWDDNDALNRQHRTWATMLFELESATGSRPIDTIESILNKDAKVATYKLALFRSFANIATTNYKIVQWTNDGRVKIPTQVLAEKWIEYYWPLIEAGIKQTTGKAVAFRTPLEDLINYYRQRGGLSAFSLEYRNQKLSAEADLICRKLLAKLKQTIWNQPVRYAGTGGDFSIFQYDKNDQTVLIGSEIWKELSLMGTWIQDATILRWAELTAKISKHELKPSAVIDCLLTVPIQERDVNAVKSFYDTLQHKRCVWTDKNIYNKYNLDHAIPFSLWKNNDLWNLLPSDAKVNGSKSDKLPENRLIKSRKECIVNYWRLIQNELPQRFEYEASKLTGQQFDQANWENRLFATFAEAIEITAIQRGIERWAPVSFAATGTDDIIYANNIVNSVEFTVSGGDDDENNSDDDKIVLPFYPDLKIACGAFRDGLAEYCDETMEIANPHHNLDPTKHFIVRTSGDSMDGGHNPIKDGDLIVLEKNQGGTISNQIFAVEYIDESGDTAYILKRIEKDQSTNKYYLVSANKKYPDIPVDPETMFSFARLKFKL